MPGAEVPDGFEWYITVGQGSEQIPKSAKYVVLGNEFNYLYDQDVIAIGNDGAVRTLFRSASENNAILLTEQCNNYCLMCSQPPKRADDRWLMEEAMDVIEMVPRSTRTLCFTGGEPTLLRDEFVDLLRHARNWLPQTALHVLSNGRAFSDSEFALAVSSVQHRNSTFGIPLYSADPARHDYIVQSCGAYDETVRGVLNLKELDQRVEIRVVIHRQNYDDLPALAEFIARNLLFVEHVAIMGLEMTGFTLANLDELWCDPYDYRAILRTAVGILSRYGIRTSVYNHQLCLVPEEVVPYCRRSISDWKNEYAPECNGCLKMSMCGGFFSAGIRHGYSSHISPFTLL